MKNRCEQARRSFLTQTPRLRKLRQCSRRRPSLMPSVCPALAKARPRPLRQTPALPTRAARASASSSSTTRCLRLSARGMLVPASSGPHVPSRPRHLYLTSLCTSASRVGTDASCLGADAHARHGRIPLFTPWPTTCARPAPRWSRSARTLARWGSIPKTSTASPRMEVPSPWRCCRPGRAIPPTSRYRFLAPETRALATCRANARIRGARACRARRGLGPRGSWRRRRALQVS
jgi:hypothetical protein